MFPIVAAAGRTLVTFLAGAFVFGGRKDIPPAVPQSPGQISGFQIGMLALGGLTIVLGYKFLKETFL